MSEPIPPAPQTGVPSPRRADRTRPYLSPAAEPPVPPDYTRFCEIHTRHRERWSLTYAAGQHAPYRAHYRHCDGIALAATDLDALAFALDGFAAAPRPPGYLVAASAEQPPAQPSARPDRVLDAGAARCLHETADDLAASTHEHAYWTSAVRDASLEILARIAALLGDACGGPEPVPNPAGRSGCLRPAAHDGRHLDGSGDTWGDDTLEDVR